MPRLAGVENSKARELNSMEHQTPDKCSTIIGEFATRLNDLVGFPGNAGFPFIQLPVEANSNQNP
jgi:hypothetical protein